MAQYRDGAASYLIDSLTDSDDEGVRLFDEGIYKPEVGKYEFAENYDTYYSSSIYDIDYPYLRIEAEMDVDEFNDLLWVDERGDSRDQDWRCFISDFTQDEQPTRYYSNGEVLTDPEDGVQWSYSDYPWEKGFDGWLDTKAENITVKVNKSGLLNYFFTDYDEEEATNLDEAMDDLEQGSCNALVDHVERIKEEEDKMMELIWKIEQI